jgi:hypothetical protein
VVSSFELHGGRLVALDISGAVVGNFATLNDARGPLTQARANAPEVTLNSRQRTYLAKWADFSVCARQNRRCAFYIVGTA